MEQTSNFNNKRPLNQITFRLLCNVSRIGGLIGPNGSIVKNLEQLSNSKISVQERNSSTENRVINVKGSPFISKRIKIPSVNGVSVEENEWFDVSAAQDGMFRVFERVVVVAADGNLDVDGIVSCRLLVGKSQVGAVIGKGGMIVEKIRRDSGCKVRVLVSDKSRAWQFPNEEIVEIEGDLLGVKKALIAVTGRLQEFSPPMIEPTPRHSPGLQPISSNSFTNSFNNGYKALDYENVSKADLTKRQQEVDFTKRQQEVVFMILCPNELVGPVIGKGGSIIRTIYKKSGAKINIGPVVVDCSERLINIHAMENVESQYSHVQNAAVLVFNRIVESRNEESGSVMGLDLDSKGTQVLARVVVPSNQVGCLLGKGGTIISEMRKATNTGLRLIGGDQVPKCVSENVEILQITGEFVNVRNVISMVVGKLREHIFFLQTSNGSSNRDPLKIDNSNYNKARIPPASGLHKPLVTSNNLSDLTRRMDQFVISKNTGQLSSQSLLASTPVSGVNGGNVMDIGKILPSSNGVEHGRSLIMTNTVEIVVPDNVIGSILGENGCNLVRLRQISGAKVTLHEPQPGTTNRILVISGSPDETQAAQSLLQAFKLCG